MEKAMIRDMCGMKLSDRMSKLKERLDLEETVVEVVERSDF